MQTTTHTTQTTQAAQTVQTAQIWYQRHRQRLADAVAATSARTYFSAFPESPSPRVYGPDAAQSGKRAFEDLLGRPFGGLTSTDGETVAGEWSPYGFELGVAYPRVTAEAIDELYAKAAGGTAAWRDAGIDARVGVAMEILDRLHARVFELANAVQHTTGQPFVMAFQAGGAHALDRALEAVGCAWSEMHRVPAVATWEKPGRRAPQRLAKTFTVAGRGIAVVIGCNTFPTWNSWPGLFASLVCGNPVIVKPHPAAVLPLAITVAACRQVLDEAGFEPDLVQLAAERRDDKLAADLATHPGTKLIDYTGSPGFGSWLETHCSQAQVFTEKAGVNAVVLDSTDDPDGMFANLAFTLSLYSGQMCTTTQNILIPADGIGTPAGPLGFREVAAGIGAAIDRLLADDERAVELLGAIVNDAVADRLAAAAAAATPADVVLGSRTISHPQYPGARIATPLLLATDADQRSSYGAECFGPVSFFVRTSGTAESVRLFSETVRDAGAMTAGIYSTDAQVLESMRAACLDVGVALSENLTGTVYVNQSAAFSDYHGTGANPAGTASFTDAAFVANRFRVIQSRRPA